MAEGKVIIVNPDMFGKDPDSKTAKANEVAKSFGLSDAALAEVEDFKAQLTKHNAWDLPFMGYVNEDGYGYAYVPGAAFYAHAADPRTMRLSFVTLSPEDIASGVATLGRVLRTHLDDHREEAP